MVKTVQISRPNIFEPTGAVAQLLERPVCVREVVGSIPGRVLPKTLKMVLADLSFALSIEKAKLVGPVCDWVEMSRHVSEVWYVSEAALLKWALSSLSDCWKRRYVWIK